MAEPQRPLMPKATAVWLVDNTALTFEQIADFCGLHPLEVKGIADEDVAKGIKGQDPVTSGQLTREQISDAGVQRISSLFFASARCRSFRSSQCAQLRSPVSIPIRPANNSPTSMSRDAPSLLMTNTCGRPRAAPWCFSISPCASSRRNR